MRGCLRRTDGLGTLIGGIFNTFPYTSFSQNVGLVGVTGVRSRWVCAMGGLILLMLDLLPKLAFVVASVPQFVLGGAGIVMFGMVVATGIRILTKVDFQANRHNLYVVAISIGIGMIPLVSDKLFSQMASIAAVALNAYFNGVRSADQAKADAAHAAHSTEAH
jgi:xanthine/uracil permease